MDLRFHNGADRSRIDVQLPADSPAPRVGDMVVLPNAPSGEASRWVVKAVVWDYAQDAVDVTVTAVVPARLPSFAAYTD